MNTHTTPALRLAEIEAARRRIATGLRLTPCLHASTLSEIAGIRITLKRDDLQRTGSFKERGARNALLCLSTFEQARGVVAASAGNHALGLAYHGAQLGIPVTVVMPIAAPRVKIDRCRALGARVVLQGQNFNQAQVHALELAHASGASMVHPFDDPRVIAGQGTLALEALEQAPEADTIVVPVGGGGLLAGVAVAVKGLRPAVRVIAVEPANAAGFLAAERCGRPTRTALLPTLADGLAVDQVGQTPFALAAPLVDEVVTVTEAEIRFGIAALARDCGVTGEGAGATALAAVLAGKVAGDSVILPVSGRNIDPHVHARILAAHAPLMPLSGR